MFRYQTWQLYVIQKAVNHKKVDNERSITYKAPKLEYGWCQLYSITLIYFNITECHCIISFIHVSRLHCLCCCVMEKNIVCVFSSCRKIDQPCGKARKSVWKRRALSVDTFLRVIKVSASLEREPSLSWGFPKSLERKVLQCSTLWGGGLCMYQLLAQQGPFGYWKHKIILSAVHMVHTRYLLHSIT